MVNALIVIAGGLVVVGVICGIIAREEEDPSSCGLVLLGYFASLAAVILLAVALIVEKT